MVELMSKYIIYCIFALVSVSVSSSEISQMRTLGDIASKEQISKIKVIFEKHACEHYRGCNEYAVSTAEPYIDGFDGSLAIEDYGYRGDGRWIESRGIHAFESIEKLPIFQINKKPMNLDSKLIPEYFVGFVINGYGNVWGGASLYIINISNLDTIEKRLNWFSNKLP